MSHTTLVRMNTGQTGKVAAIRGGRGLVIRLESLGIRPGVKIEKVSGQFMRGPIIVKVGTTQVAIGFGMAHRVIVEI